MSTAAPISDFSSRPILRTGRGALVFLAVCGLAIVGIGLASPDVKAIAWPTVVQVIIGTVFILSVWRRNTPFPLFDVGVLFGLVSFLYTTVPFAMFWAAGGAWSALSDGRLLVYNPTAAEMQPLAWMYVAFFASYVFALLATRRRQPAAFPQVAAPDLAMIKTLLVLFVIVQMYLWALQAITGINLYPSYLAGGLDEGAGYYALPLFMQQITHNAVGVAVALKIVLAGAMLLRWPTKTTRAIIILWVVGDIALTAIKLGSRTFTALFALGVLLLWHRFVKPIRLHTAIAFAVVLVVGIALFGIIRTFGGSFAAVQLADQRLWTAQNDFQTMFASAFDIDRTVHSGTIGDAPWQAYASDLFLVIPSQFLPFHKTEPSTWYYGAIHAQTSSMFGMMAQGVIGFGWIEMAIRGLFMGWLYSRIHDWYVRRSASFWVTLLYCYLCVWSHYSFRSTMLWPAYFIVYEFLPVMLLGVAIRRLFVALSRRALATQVPAT